VRKRLRFVCMANGSLTAKAATEEDSVYRLYYDFREPLSRIAGHRVLAINRGEREELLKVSVEFDRDKAMRIIESEHVREGSPCTAAVREAANDAYDRLIIPSIEREIRNELTEKASDAAIKVFSTNLRQLLQCSRQSKEKSPSDWIPVTEPAAKLPSSTALEKCWTPG